MSGDADPGRDRGTGLHGGASHRDRRVGRRGPATTLRVAGGTVATLAPLALGVLGHSPWKALLLVPAFAASWALGRAGVWRERLRHGSRGEIARAAARTVAVQLALAAGLYLAGLALGALLGDALPVDPLGRGDLAFVAWVSVVALGCGAASARFERRAAERRAPDPS